MLQLHVTILYAMLQAENAMLQTKSVEYTITVKRKVPQTGTGKAGESMKQSRTYYPNQIQLRIIEVADRNNVKVQVLERAGQSDAFACVGGCSNAVISTAYELGLVDRKVTVRTSRGALEVELKEDGRVEVFGEESKNTSVVLSRR